MHTEDDLRSALSALECHTPDATAVLAAVRAKTGTRQVTIHRRRRWPLVAAAATSIAAVSAAAALSGGTFGPGIQTGQPGSAGDAAAVLRQLAAKAAAQPIRAVGPVLYTADALLGPDAARHDRLPYLGGIVTTQREWVSAAARYFTTVDQRGKRSRGSFAAGYATFDPRNNPDWNWRNPATLPANSAALRRHLLSAPDGKAAGTAGGPPVTPDETVFNGAFQLMTTEPLRPAVRSAMLGLIADVVQRSPHDFVVLGAFTDRTGHRDIAIAGESDQKWTPPASSSNPHAWKLARTRSTALLIYFFDPSTGGIRAGEYATCSGRVSTFAMANARCRLGGYEQYLLAEGVRTLPRRAPDAMPQLAPYVFSWPLVIK